MMVDRRWPAWKGLAMLGEENSTARRAGSNEAKRVAAIWHQIPVTGLDREKGDSPMAFLPAPTLLLPYPGF